MDKEFSSVQSAHAMLAAACKLGVLSDIHAAIESCPDVSKLFDPTYGCEPYLLYLCSNEIDANVALEACSYLLGMGCGVDVAAANGQTAIMLATHRANAPLIELLLSFGANINAVDSCGDSSLFYLLRNVLNTTGQKQGSMVMTDEQMVAFQMVLSAGFHVNQGDRHKTTALNYCCIFGLLRGVEMLMSAGADPNSVDQSGFSALMTCAKLGHVHIARCLLSHGADLYIVFLDTLDAMALACRLGKAPIVHILLESGYDPNRIMANGSLPIIEAIYFLNIEIIEVLLQFGANVNCCSRQAAIYPIVSACLVGSLEVSRLLVEHGADISVQTELGSTALMGACSKENLELVAYLLDVPGCDVNARGYRDGQTALMVACMNEPSNSCTAIVAILLRRGADVNIQSFAGLTALMAAVEHMNFAVVKYLVLRGADLDLRNVKGKRAVDVTVDEEYREFLKREMRWRARRYAAWLSIGCVIRTDPVAGGDNEGKNNINVNILYSLPADVSRYTILFL